MSAAAGDAHPFPIYGGRYRVYFPILDNDGDEVTSGTLDSERSIDGATASDCSNEATQIATTWGGWYLDLIYTEMQSSCTMVRVKSDATDAKPTFLTIYPRRLSVLESGTAQAGAAGTITLAAGASDITDFYVGLYVQCSNDTPTNVRGQTRLITAYNGGTQVATVNANWGTNPSSSTTYDILLNTASDTWQQTLTLPGQEAPANAPTAMAAVTWPYKMMRNKKTQTATTFSLFDDAGSTVDAKATVSDNGTTATKAELETGP